MAVFTGAGLSTACGIPDYRSGVNTVVETGAGHWEKKAVIDAAKAKGVAVKQVPKNEFNKRIVDAEPSKTHMALVELCNQGILKNVISQNVDGLHLKSGIPSSKLVELHGNVYTEQCTKCQKKYIREERVQKNADRLTGNICEDKKCGGPLKDSIINFGQGLVQEDIQKGFEIGQAADLMVIIGSSCRVQPATSMAACSPMMGGKLVVINLQKTPLEPLAHMNIFAKIDTVFEGVMERLKLKIPEYKAERHLKMRLATGSNKFEYLLAEGIDKDEVAYKHFKKIELNGEKFDKIPLKEDERQPDSVYEIKLTYEKFNELTIYLPRSYLSSVNDFNCRITFDCDPKTGMWNNVAAFKKEKKLADLKFDQSS